MAIKLIKGGLTSCVAAVLMVVMTLQPLLRASVPCDGYPSGWLADPDTRKGVNGELYLTFSVNTTDMTEEMYDEISDAIWEWNSRSGQTGVVIEWIGDNNNSADMMIEIGNTGNACAGADRSTGGLVINDTLDNNAGTYPAQAQSAVAHEVGHFLGLGHSSDSSDVMYPPSYSGGCTASNVAGLPTTNVGDDDAMSGYSCAASKAAGTNFGNGGGENETQYNETQDCAYYYWTTVTWTYTSDNGGYWYLSSINRTYLWDDCPPES